MLAATLISCSANDFPLPVCLAEKKLYGGFGENKLSSYEYTAAVNADTNGLKTAVKNADGTYSFSARQTGSGKSFAESYFI